MGSWRALFFAAGVQKKEVRREQRMTEIVKELSSARLLPALEANMVEFYVAWGRAPQAALWEEPDLIRVYTGLPFALLNGIFGARLAPGTVDTTIEATIAYLAPRRVPALWWTGPGTQPPDLGRHLQGHGFVHARDVPGMAVDLLALQEDHPRPPGLTIERVEDGEMLRTWARIAWVGTGFPETHQDEFAGLEVRCRIAPGRPRYRYLGFQNGVPVATSALVLHAGVAGIYAVATLPEARRQGLGTAVTLAPLRDARELGYRVGTLQASEMGFPVYRQLGFREVCRLGNYVWKEG
jgi:GNAT superfamily N-acetyltransferase